MNLKKDFAYISCFTHKHDDLNQWRAYADNGYGVCLHFDFNVLEGDSASDDFVMGDVIYLYKIEDKRKENLNEKFISEKWEKELNIIEDYFGSFYDSIFQTNGIFTPLSIPTPLKKHIRFYKNIKFQEENEFRQVCLNENEKYQKKTRIRKEYLVPYIELPIRKSISKRIKGKLTEEWGESSLTGITIGPAVKDFDKAKRSFKLFFEEFDKENGTNYSSIPIGHSEIPFLP